jgi:hypothetical protein
MFGTGLFAAIYQRLNLKWAVIPFVVAAACSLLFFASSLAATFTDKQAVRAHVAAGFASKSWYPHGNDCLVLYMLVSPYDTRSDEVLFPKNSTSGDKCTILREMVEGKPPGEFRTYQRYLHGIRTIVAPLVSHFSIHAAMTLLLTASYTLLSLALAVLIWRRWQQGIGTKAGPVFGIGLAALGVMLTFYVTPYYSTSLAFASSDLSIYALILAAITADLRSGSLRQIAVLASIFGAIIAYLEFLTGQAPLGLTLLVAMVAASAPPTVRPAALVQRCFWTAYSFVGSFVLCFAIKMVTLLFIGADTGGFASSLLQRIGGPLDGTDTLPTILTALQEFAKAAPWLGRGSSALGLTLIFVAGIGLAGGAALRWRRLPDTLERTRTVVLVGAALVLPAWYLVFLQHTIVHAGFMIRPLVGLIAIGLWFGCSELLQAMRAIIRLQSGWNTKTV